MGRAPLGQIFQREDSGRVDATTRRYPVADKVDAWWRLDR